MVALIDEIRALPPELLATRNTQAIADALSVGRKRPTSREVGNGLVLETLGLDVGNTLLDLVQSDNNLRHVRPLLEQGRLVVSSGLVSGWFGGLVAAHVLTREQADAVIALGYEDAPVSEFEVREVCIGKNGEWMVTNG